MLKMMRNILAIFLGLLIGGYIALVCVYALPTDAIRQNVSEASNIIQMEGSHPELIYGHQDTMLDNLTDSIMLLTARYEIQENIFTEALLSNRETADGMMDSEILAFEAEGHEVETQTAGYGRYWHGYLLYLKPLLMVFNYGQIRYLIGFVQMMLFAAVLYLMTKKQKEKHLLPFVTTYLFMNPAALTLSLQYLPISLITMIQMIVLLCCEKKYKEDHGRWIYHFFIVGCLVSYFDLLTYPLLTLGIPLVFLLAENSKSFQKDCVQFVKCCAAWGGGYVMMWAGKWLLGSLFTKENLIADALESVLLRTGVAEDEIQVSAFEAILKNIGVNKLGLLLVILAAAVLIIYSVWKYRNMEVRSNPGSILLCACLPFAWYVVISNHSYIHYWFTYRILGISIYAGLLWLAGLFQEKHRGED